MSKLGEQITIVVMAIIGVSALAVILSQKSNTTNVIGAAAQG